MLAAENEAFLQELLVKHAGVSFVGEQSHVLTSRLSSLAKQKRLESADALVKSLRAAPSEALLDSVIEALTTHETCFFRDVAVYRTLGDVVIPELLKRRVTSRALSIWSAGCSTGQEPYSVAMLLRERFPELGGWRVRIWATDVSSTIVERAREGRYAALDIRRGLTAAARDKYFTASGGAYQLNEQVKRMVSWEVMNLSAAWPAMASFDLILMRNVLIYFSPEARSRALAQAAANLTPDGYLVLGTSETTFGASEELMPNIVQGSTVYRRTAK